jgi:TetR/AcrR family transcriptional regulator, transcriptional repressor for nem operon
MNKTKADSRTRLLQAAEKTTYRRGFGQTALADIAKEARVPLGNVYYYFRTKDAIGNALVERRIARFRKLLEELGEADSPAERLRGFVDVKIKNREELARSGCPVGTWCSELHKQGGPVAKKSTALFVDALKWMEEQFRELGKGDEARGLAVHLLSATQGVSVLAHTFHDASLIEMEAERLKNWIRALGSGAKGTSGQKKRA